jgi:hypothetical protein
VIRVYDAAGQLIKAPEREGEFKEWYLLYVGRVFG